MILGKNINVAPSLYIELVLNRLAKIYYTYYKKTLIWTSHFRDFRSSGYSYIIFI